MKGHRWHRWTSNEDARLIQLRAADYSYGDIAQALGKTGGTVYRRLRTLRAMGRVREGTPGRATPPAQEEVSTASAVASAVNHRTSTA